MMPVHDCAPLLNLLNMLWLSERKDVVPYRQWAGLAVQDHGHCSLKHATDSAYRCTTALET